MTPHTALADEYGPLHATGIIETLRRAGYIVVVKDAIRLAQAHARADNDNEAPKQRKKASSDNWTRNKDGAIVGGIGGGGYYD